MRLNILPAILLTATIFLVAVSFARLEPLNGGHIGLIFLWWAANSIQKVRVSNE